MNRPTLNDVEGAAARIEGRVRRTPMLAPAPVREPLGGGEFETHLKLE